MENYNSLFEGGKGAKKNKSISGNPCVSSSSSS